MPKTLLFTIENKDGLVSRVVAHTLCTLKPYFQHHILTNNSIKFIFECRENSILILPEQQISELVKLRLGSYMGAVLILAYQPYLEVRKKNRILRCGSPAHAGCDFPWQLTDIIEKITQLQPLHPSNLEILQKELKAPELLRDKIQKLLQNPAQNSQHNSSTIQEIIDILCKIRQQTPGVCHTVVEIAGNSAQIQHHFHRIMEQLQQSKEPNLQLFEQLRSVLQKWSDITMSTGEGLGKLNFLE